MIEIVIKIEEETYNRIMNGWMPLHKTVNLMENVQKGTPLPEHHGRLIDADAIQKYQIDTFGKRLLVIDTAPTIIEADRAESEEAE
jgi:hypothetical protein